ncbi:MAG TPA: NfeD family protein [Acidimicrobiales bacterium]|nr:NfeD family protein [Acidimicrobiales bacterium]
MGRAIDVIEVSGRIDPIEVDFITKSVRQAETSGDEVLVIQLDSPGALVDSARLNRLAARLRTAQLPVAVWVGPSGARAYGGATRLLEAADVAGMAPGTHVGKSSVIPGSLGSGAARARGAVDVIAPTLGEFIVGLDGQEIDGTALHTARVVTEGGQPRRQAAAQVRFAKLGLLERVLHATSGPQLAYILLVAGLLLIVFEFFTAAVGLAGAAGAASLVLAAYGLAVLPTSRLGLFLICLGILGFAINAQAGKARVWTVIGTVSLLVGSWILFPGGLALSWVPIVIVVAGVVVFMVLGMASMVRARFSTPAIERGPLVGRSGEATTAVGTKGTVRMGGGLWPARSRGPQAITEGAPVRVSAVDGLILEVEPAAPAP